MTKSLYEVSRHPARFGAVVLLAIAVALIALLIARIDTEAVHNEGMLEMDGNVAYDGGDGFDPGTTNCPYVYQSAGAPVDGGAQDCIIGNSAAFDWADVCDRTASGALAGYITEASSLPTKLANAEVVCQQDFIIGATNDISYHKGSDKDFQEMGGGGTDRWACEVLSNATSKADILNGYGIVASVDEDPDPAVEDPHQTIYIGVERDAETGSVFNGYWILQSGVGVPGATTTAGQMDCTPVAPAPFAGLHVCGDILVRFNYDNGGRIGSIRVNEWVAPSPGVIYSPPFSAARGCDNLTGTGDANSDDVIDNVDDCTAA